MSESRLDVYLDRVRALEPLVRAHAARSERDAQLASEVVDAFHVAGLFRVLLPAAMNGGALTLPEALRLYEAAARLDGSAGWNLAICSGGPLFGHFISRDAFDALFADPRAVVAGSLNPLNTRVVAADGGWRFSGKSTFVSGSANATWMMASGIELADGAPRMIDGFPAMRAGLFPIAKVRILDTWSVSGMRGTGSNDVLYDDVLVPDALSYEWPNPRSTWQTGPFASIPLTVQLGGTLSAVALGTARHAIDALLDLAVNKVPTGTRASLRERPLAQMQLAQAEGLVEAGRAYLYRSYDDAWRAGASGATFDARARAAMRLASVTSVKLAAQAVDLVHDAAGATAIQTSCDIERCWRDVHAMTQHVILSTGRYEVVGRVLFGLDPGTPVI
jgi:alkylation response protein AidB-like acyl-CoA dehydrogenase